MKVSDNMNQEIVKAEINHYTSLLRIKKTMSEKVV